MTDVTRRDPLFPYVIASIAAIALVHGVPILLGPSYRFSGGWGTAIELVRLVLLPPILLGIMIAARERSGRRAYWLLILLALNWIIPLLPLLLVAVPCWLGLGTCMI